MSEAHDLVVIDLAERHIDGQFAGQRRIVRRIGHMIVRMHVADQRRLRVGEVRDRGVGRVQARRRGIRVGGIAGQQEVIVQAQQPQVAPVAGVVFLAV